MLNVRNCIVTSWRWITLLKNEASSYNHRSVCVVFRLHKKTSDDVYSENTRRDKSLVDNTRLVCLTVVQSVHCVLPYISTVSYCLLNDELSDFIAE